MKVKMVTTYPPDNCGIAIYSERFVESLKKLCPVEVLPIGHSGPDPLKFIRLALESRKNADIVHVQFDCGFFGTMALGGLSISGMYTPLYYLLVRSFGGPRVVNTVHELHDARKDYAGRALYWPMRLYYTCVYRPMVRYSDAVIAHTRETISALSQYAGTEKMEVIPLACIYEPVLLPQEECKDKLGLRGKRVAAMFGFVNRFKGHDLAIDAIAAFPDDVVLYIAGDGRTPEDKAYVAALKDKVAAMGLERRVRFHGYASEEEAATIICAADVVLLPYRHVVQSSALNYVLPYMKPVLASDIGGFAEVAKAYGCLETFRQGDTADLGEKLRMLLADTGIGEALKSRIPAYIKAIGADAVAARTVDVYGRILAKGR